ncbi:MAG: hypothetical protein ACK47B_14410, partial [Armatimonadota bacterium]
MSTAVAEMLYTPESLLELPDGGKGYELVDGRLVEKRMGGYASWVAGRILKLLAQVPQFVRKIQPRGGCEASSEAESFHYTSYIGMVSGRC